MPENYYDSDRGISEYLLFHYGGYEPDFCAPPDGGLSFPVRCVTECVNTARLPQHARALDLGCAVGGSSFELARWCGHVVGIDYSARFVEVATHLRNNGSYAFPYFEEGELTLPRQAAVPAEIDRNRVNFERGDAVRLRTGLGLFDVVLMANLIDRVDDPAQCLGQLPALLKPAGQLVITSPYTWLADYTPREKWLGGFLRDGKPVRAFDTLQEILAPNFELARRKDMPFVIREHARKFQLSFAEATTWLRR